MLDPRTLTVVFAAALAVAACGDSTSGSSSSSSAAAGSAGVSLGTAAQKISATDQKTFIPATVTAHVGDIVGWTNAGTIQHTVTFDTAGSLSDSSLQPGSTWQVKFATAGSYTYHCDIHPGMTGTITVS